MGEDENCRMRSFRWTDYKMKASTWDDLFEEGWISYIIAGEEICPDTGRMHWQGYCHLVGQKRWSFIQKKLKNIWFGKCDKSAQQNYDYCTKDGVVIYEKGKRPLQGERTDINIVVHMVKKGDSEQLIWEKCGSTYLKYHKHIEHCINKFSEPYVGIREVVILWGEAGSGKSRHAYDNNNAEPVSFNHGFFDYLGGEVVCFDDCSYIVEKLGRELFLQITDRYKCRINVKNGYKWWNVKKIYITCNNNPEDWIVDPAVRRRITRIRHFQ